MGNCPSYVTLINFIFACSCRRWWCSADAWRFRLARDNYAGAPGYYDAPPPAYYAPPIYYGPSIGIGIYGTGGYGRGYGYR
jgi:hypothetical protein